MKHNIRINGEVKQIDCELGSGRLDCEGREIFEGDKLEYIAKVNEIFVGTVQLKSAEFVVDGVPFVEFLSLYTFLMEKAIKKPLGKSSKRFFIFS